jgi:hypothetical protein
MKKISSSKSMIDEKTELISELIKDVSLYKF